MKGVVFTEFLDLVEDKFGYNMVDRIIEESVLPSGGSYTAIGTYPFAEMISLLSRLSANTNIPTDKLLHLYGRHFFSILLKSYPQFIVNLKDSFQLFESIDRHIHVEVKKLYPDAELPRFETTILSDTQIEMVYYSERKMSDFAQGLLESSMGYYGEIGVISKELLDTEGTKVKFLISKNKV
jgi:Haem-NO-binding